MKVAEYIARYLKKCSVTDAYGIPGGVILDLLYAFNDEGIMIHLCAHEQAAAFAALGQAQVSHSLAVAYATRGPGISNMFTAIAEAYYESIPVLFITGHTCKDDNKQLRAVEEQEMDIVKNVYSITKYVSRVDSLSELQNSLYTAVSQSIDGRKGPVLLDINSSLFSVDMDEAILENQEKNKDYVYQDLPLFISKTDEWLTTCQKPLVLLGDGIKQSNLQGEVKELLEGISIPIVSSRGAQDVMAGCDHYFGYIGSHGLRYANLIFEKSDFVLVLGNRMAFPLSSTSFLQAFENKHVVRVEIDISEKSRNIPNTDTFCFDMGSALPYLEPILKSVNVGEWLACCKQIKDVLFDCDCNRIVESLVNVLGKILPSDIIVSDVGNNEFWLSKAYEKSHCRNRLILSKSFGTLGSAIGRAIGVYYASHCRVICCVGDQGFQLNIQELQTISKQKLPITVVVINDHSSAMIRDREKARYGKLLHTTSDSGYYSVDVEKISIAFSIPFFHETVSSKLIETEFEGPAIVEISIDDVIELAPSLPRGSKMSNMSPILDTTINQLLQRII